MAADLSINYKVHGLSSGMITKLILPSVHKAVDAIGKQVAAKWVEEVYKARLWSGEKDAYAQSISWKMTGDFEGVVVADYKWARQIEDGRPARDLKRMLGTSLKVRRTEKGNRFLVIPFRQNVGKMPPELYAQAKAMAPSKVTGMGERRSGEITRLQPKFGMHPASASTQNKNPFLTNLSTKQAQTVAKAQIAWGGRIKPDQLPAGASKNYAGMVRFDTSSGKQKSSQYLTFRIMSDKSKGWIVPAQPGQKIARRVVDQIQPKAAKFLEQATLLDINKAAKG
ncbi:hypothetical protein EF72_21375 [Salmonella enterica]|nr:hypothetical protein [Salmonella enterica]